MDESTLRQHFAARPTAPDPSFHALLDTPRAPKRIRPAVAATTLGITACVAVLLAIDHREDARPAAVGLMAWTAATDALLPVDVEPTAFDFPDPRAER